MRDRCREVEIRQNVWSVRRDEKRREFYQTMTATAARASPNKRFNEQINGSVLSLGIIVYISLPSSAKQPREMTKFYLVWRKRTAMANGLVSSFGIERCRCMFSLQGVSPPPPPSLLKLLSDPSSGGSTACTGSQKKTRKISE